MLRLDVSPFEAAFQANLTDWCLGGPKTGGWSRRGRPVPTPTVRLANARRATINTEDGLSKNRPEVERWHIAFLKGYPHRYRSEYLWTRHGRTQPFEDGFNQLFKSMSESGFREQWPVMVADTSSLGIGVDVFRFDGCHRLACAFVLGIKEVPAYVFTPEACP